MNATPLNDEHRKLGAKMVWFAGWDMPIQYTSIIDEHMTVRNACGAFDVSHMGDFIIRGPGAAEVIDLLMTNKVRDAPAGRCVYSHLLDQRGKILDDTIASPLGKDEYFMVPNAATTSKMRKWVESHLDGQELVDMSSDLAAIAVQGPRAAEVVQRLTSADLGKVGFFWATVARLDHIDSKGSRPKTELLRDRRSANGQGEGIMAYLSRTGYTGEDGFEIVCENADAHDVWRAVLEKGRDLGLRPIGLGARDTLRLEKALLLSGTDFDGNQTSVQTGPSWVVDWGHEFMGRKVLEEQRASGAYDKLVCIEAKDKGIPRHGYELHRDGAKVGTVTSGTMSPVLKKGIAMGYVPAGMSAVGTALQVKVRDTLVEAEVVKPPFVRRG
ncbi:MAG: glycine cleavage system aminomethyltransferase GcvT [Thermoplasmata archaeon]|nr:glycine cleavage system aminomethyltransferase GcvT [Thermoplasmata archaeon]